MIAPKTNPLAQLIPGINVTAIQAITELVMITKPMAMKAKPGAADLARRHVKKPEELREIIRHLKLRNYIR